MKYLLSMDGGGSKTAWLLTNESGEKAAEYICGGCSHPQMGLEAVMELIYSGVEELVQRAGCKKQDIWSAAFGVPCFGEYPEVDRIIRSDLEKYLESSAVEVYNDVELGMAGSLCLESGIHLVAGTGAIACGKSSSGAYAQSNGWHPYFSDEGSGYWLGMQTLSLFAKQADRRTPRSALYSIVREKLGLREDLDIITYYDENLSGNRKNTAALQLFLKEAAAQGDESALRLYEKAAYELYLSVAGVYQTLSFSADDRVKVSYSGGLFAEDNYLLQPFSKWMEQLSVELIQPYLSPVCGGILLAAHKVSGNYKDISIILKLNSKGE